MPSEPFFVLGVTALAFLLLAGGAGLVALSIHLLNKWRTHRHRREKAAWRPLLHQVLTQETPPTALLDRVHPLRYDAFLSFLTPYAGTIEGSERPPLRTLARPFLPVVCRRAKTGPPMQRAQAVRRIGLFGGPRHVPLLRTLLQDDNPPLVLRNVVQELGRLGTAADVPLILQHLDRLSHMDRRQLSSSLYELGEDAAPPLRNALANESPTLQRCSSFVRVVCAETLRWLGDAPSGPAAATLLRDAGEDDPEVVASLLRLLRRVGRPRDAAAVRPYCRFPISFVRIHAARALGPLGSDADEARLESMLRDDDDRWVALSAARSLAELGQWAPLRRLQNAGHPRTPLIAGLLPSTA